MLTAYTVSIGRRNEHLFSITMDFEAPRDNPRIQLASWTPGSYLIRDYSRHIQEMKLQIRGREVDIKQISKNTWEIPAKKGDMVNLGYHIYSFELTVRTNYLDHRKGLLIGCNSFVYILTEEGTPAQNPSEVRIRLPDGWRAFTSMKNSEGTYRAESLDELLDSPIGFATTEVLDYKKYDYEGIPCEIVIIGDRGNHEIATLERDLQKLQNQSVSMFGELPYDRYVWMLYIVGSGGGGLEHKYSNVSIVNRFAFSDPEKYKNGVLRLESHEHFHVFNVKRIRPHPLGPFDYANEVYTTGLWIAEGLTNFYESLFLLREGIIDLDKYLEWKSKDINRYFETPGRMMQSVAQSSFNAWIKLYKSDENTVNTTISYYLKGGLVGLLLDIHIVYNSAGKFTLDDVYRHLWEKYKRDRSSYDEDRFADIIKEVTGVDCKDFFLKYVYGTEELPFEKYLEYIGINFEMEDISSNDLDGVTLEKNTVKKILSNSSWVKSGLAPKDKIVAVNSYEVKDSKSLGDILSGLEEDSPLTLHIFRDGKLLVIKGVLHKIRKKYSLSVFHEASEEAVKLRDKLFNGQ